MVGRDKGGETLAEREQNTQAQLKADVRNHPAVQAVLNAFPGAEIVEVRRKSAPEILSDNPADDFDAPAGTEEE
jgi:DNA polymerase-3 subunit gamma/tau